MRYVVGECFYHAAPDEAEENIQKGVSTLQAKPFMTLSRLSCWMCPRVHACPNADSCGEMLAAAEEAKESVTSLEAELESTKAQMADLKKVQIFTSS